MKCRKVTHNGRPELWYDIAQYDSLDTAAGAMDTEKLAATLAELATVLQSAEKNGFMDTKNIPLEPFLHIYKQRKQKAVPSVSAGAERQRRGGFRGDRPTDCRRFWMR